jgi:hypothetical protein
VIQQGGVLGNYYEVGIGIFGHRGITTPRFWSFYRANAADPGTFELLDHPAVELGEPYRVLFHHVGNSNYEIEIDGTAYGAQRYVDADWFGVFNENYNESNTLCDWMHVTYSASTHVLDLRAFDHQFDACHWGINHNWEVYWETQSPFYCNPPDPDEPPGGLTPDFPSSPVLP